MFNFTTTNKQIILETANNYANMLVSKNIKNENNKTNGYCFPKNYKKWDSSFNVINNTYHYGLFRLSLKLKKEKIVTILLAINDLPFPFEICNIILSYFDFNDIHTNISLYNYIHECPKDEYYKISMLDTTCVTSLHNIFNGMSDFNENLNNWNTSNVYDMDYTFNNCYKFNQILNNWKTTKVKTMRYMFANCIEFNGLITSWDVKNVTNMACMFMNCKKLNQYLNNWNVTKVTNMDFMFSNCHIFNMQLDNWCTIEVKTMICMFMSCKQFNQDLSKWNVKQVINMNCMFSSCRLLNIDFRNWDLNINIVNNNMFRDCIAMLEEYKI